MSTRAIVTKAWLTSFGDFLTLLLCMVVVTFKVSETTLSTRNHSDSRPVVEIKSNLASPGTPVATSKGLALLRKSFFDGLTRDSLSAKNFRESVEKEVGNSGVEVELCLKNTAEIAQYTELLKEVFGNREVSLFVTSDCSELTYNSNDSGVFGVVRSSLL